MSDTDPEIEIVETEAAPPPSGTPRHFRELVALALKTTDPAVLDAAEQDYRGIHSDVDAYVRDQIAEHLPSHLLWPIAVGEGRCAVFESVPERCGRRPR